MAQNGQAQRGWEAGGWVGVNNYFGDLNTSYSLSRPGIAGGAVARFNFNERLSLKMSGSYGSVSADDKFSTNVFEQRRNLNFRSVIVDGAAQMEVNFMQYSYFNRDMRFSPYLFGGLNIFYFQPQGNYEGKWYELRPMGTEGQFRGEEYYTTQLGLVYGGGFKIALNETWSINVELSLRKLFTDYLDDVSGTYPNMNDLRKQRSEMAVLLSDPSLVDEEGNKLGLRNRQRGDSKRNDMYTFFGVSLLYYFGDLKCPPISTYR